MTPHWKIIIEDLERNPGSTWLEVTLRTKIPSPHRRAPEWKRWGYEVASQKFVGRWYHWIGRRPAAPVRPGAEQAERLTLIG